ncbi:MAG: sigma 54-interacting transcriptional regulator [Polyangiaceae bacterium]|nr:sigma 54-interacting transcriptional regulator [Polyangiaceae bacterium]
MDKTVTQPTGRTSEPEAEREPTQVLTLLVECDRPAGGSELIVLTGVEAVTIGRGEHRGLAETEKRSGRTLALTVPDRRISSSHAVLERTAQGFRIRDLGSANGTRIGGERVEQANLHHGDIIQIGHTLFAFEDKQLPARVPVSVGQKTKISTLSPSYAQRLAQLSRIAMTPIPVLFLGESGTGKEVLARVTHELSGRPGAFVPVNCGAIPPNLVESHLFGHQKGSFSGAVRDEIGFVRAADGGTLFLDEIGDLPPASQAALLRVLQEGEVHPVGAARAVKVDVRIVAATHRPLDRMQDEGSFRRDLYARLSGFVVQLPSLRERMEDIGQLIGELLSRSNSTVRIRPEAATQMLRYDWPLNVRELAQCLSTASALATDGVIRGEHLPPALTALTGPPTLAPRSAPGSQEPAPPSKTAPLSPEDQALRDDLVRRLEESGFNISAVARDMGKARQQVQRWVRRFGLKGS